MLKELREKFKKAMADAEAIRAKYQGKSDSMTADEEQQWSKHLDEAEGYRKQIENIEREERLKSWGKESAGQIPIAGKEKEGHEGEEEEEGSQGTKSTERESATATKQSYLKMIGDIEKHNPRLARGLKAALKPTYMRSLEDYLRAGGQLDMLSAQARKDLTEGVDSQGGFWVPEDFRTEIIKKLPTMAEMRNGARVMGTSSDHVVFPLEDYTDDDKYTSSVRLIWVDENPGSDTEIDVSDNEPGVLDIYVYTGMAGKLISNNLIEDNAFDLLGYVQNLLTEAFALGENDAFINGNGKKKPWGLFNPANPQFPATVNSGDATKVKADGVIDLFYALPKQYRQNAVFMFNSNTAKELRKLKDAQNRYLWDAMSQGGISTAGDRDTLLGKEVVIDEFCPDIAANSYPIAFGDRRGYYVMDRVGMSIQILREKYAERNKIKIIARKRVGGQIGERFRFRLQKIAA